MYNGIGTLAFIGPRIRKIVPDYIRKSNSLEELKDTRREKAPSNKTPALRKSTNMGIWAVGTLNQLFIRGF